MRILVCDWLWWALLVVAATSSSGQVYKIEFEDGSFEVNTKTKTFIISRKDATHEIDMGLMLPAALDAQPCEEGDLCLDFNSAARLVVRLDGHCQAVEWTVTDKNALQELKDCVIMAGHWYGGGETYNQPWPLEQEARVETPYVVSCMLHKREKWYGGVMEPYWISSEGLAIMVSRSTPLFLSVMDENGDGTADELCLASRHQTPFAWSDDPLTLHYRVCTADDVKQVHEATLSKLFTRPPTTPDQRIFQEPIWCTWAEYKRDINEEKVVAMANDIIKNGYPYSQIEIDDNWETCYGSHEFNTKKFPDPKTMVDSLHELNFRVSLWIHPFINNDCYAFDYPDKQGFFVKDSSGKTQLTDWWRGDYIAGIIDFTNSDAVSWWKQRLLSLQQTTGIDTFKFDAGEASWLPAIYTLNATQSVWPNVYSTKFIETVSTFGGLIEVRAGYDTQKEPVFVRMLDKDSNWSNSNGLKTLVTTLLQFGILGYPFVLPDMIGGNAYGGQPSDELFIRWAQANAFMPTLQYSLLPWRFGDKANQVALEMSKLHQQYSPQLMEAAVEATNSSAPINRPTWWLCPTDEACLTADQQFLLGNDILVAPVTEEGATTKTVVIPPGSWKSSIDDQLYEGIQTVTVDGVVLEVLLYFTRVTNEE